MHNEPSYAKILGVLLLVIGCYITSMLVGVVVFGLGLWIIKPLLFQSVWLHSSCMVIWYAIAFHTAQGTANFVYKLFKLEESQRKLF